MSLAPLAAGFFAAVAAGAAIITAAASRRRSKRALFVRAWLRLHPEDAARLLARYGWLAGRHHAP